MIGSLISSVYASRLGGVSDALPSVNPAAFTDAVGIGFAAAAGIAVVGAIVVRRYLPSAPVRVAATPVPEGA